MKVRKKNSNCNILKKEKPSCITYLPRFNYHSAKGKNLLALLICLGSIILPPKEKTSWHYLFA
jgi:hypothetical protein